MRSGPPFVGLIKMRQLWAALSQVRRKTKALFMFFPFVLRGFLLLDKLPHRAVTRIPGGLVIDDDVDTALFGGPGDGVRVFQGRGQGLFDHHVQPAFGAGLDDATVIERAGEGGHGLNIGAHQQLLKAGAEKIGGQIEDLGVMSR